MLLSNDVNIISYLISIPFSYELFSAFKDTEKDISLVDLKMSIEKFNQRLEKINENQKESIASFTKAKDLVQWMRSALPG